MGFLNGVSKYVINLQQENNVTVSVQAKTGKTMK